MAMADNELDDIRERLNEISNSIMESRQEAENSSREIMTAIVEFRVDQERSLRLQERHTHAILTTAPIPEQEQQ